MKKAIKSAGVVVMLVLIMPLLAIASQEHQIDRRPIEAKEVKIHKKEKLPNLEKGKPVKPPVVNPEGFSAVGVPGAPVTGQKYAILVGICDYPGATYDICKSDGDAYRMNQVVKKYGYADSNIILLRDAQATYNNIYDAIANIKARENAGDEVMFFFSGHGTTGVAADGDKEKQDEGIVAHDGSKIEIIWDGQLNSWFSGFETSRIIFIFDSCRAGGMNDVQKDGRIVVMSSLEKENSFVYTNSELGEGLFSHFFNKAMLEDLADNFNLIGSTDGKVAIEEAASYTKQNVNWFVSNYNLPHLQTVNVSDLFEKDLIL